MAARLVFVPTSLTVSQWFPWPGFWNRTLWYLSPFDRTAHLDEEVDVAVVVPVAAGDAVAFLKVAGPRGAGDVGESACRRRS